MLDYRTCRASGTLLPDFCSNDGLSGHSVHSLFHEAAGVSEEECLWAPTTQSALKVGNSTHQQTDYDTRFSKQ